MKDYKQLCEVCKGEGYIPNKYKPELNDPCIACRTTGKNNILKDYMQNKLKEESK